MKKGRYFCEFTLVSTQFDFILGLGRPSFKPASGAGGASVSAAVKKGVGMGWGIRTHSGALCHAGRGKSWEGQKKMRMGSTVGLLLDLYEGSLTCYLDATKLGSVVPEGGGLEGPLVWMVELLNEGDAVRIQNCQPPVGTPPKFKHEKKGA